MSATKETSKKVAPRVESYDIAKSDETLDLAKDLAKFIKDNKLCTQVQGKEFVNVEGWQYAGSRLGIVPIVEHVINVSTEHEVKYQAKVTLFDMRSQHTVGAGFAVCSNKESGKKFYQEFAIASMAQTRAIGKAYRNILAWIIRAAGYEPTPAEEMSEVHTGAEVLHSQPTGNGAGGSPTASEPPVMPTEAEIEAARIAKVSAGFTQAAQEFDAHVASHRAAASSSAAPVASAGAGPSTEGLRQELLQLLDTLDKNLDKSTDRDSLRSMRMTLTHARLVAILPDYRAQVQGLPPYVYASAQQKEEIIRLLNYPVITRQEKTKMLLNINRLDEERATQAIDKLKKVIEDREGSTAVAA